MPGSMPFTKKCDAYQRMVELLEDGTIGPDMAPCDAYRTDPMFLQYSEVAFIVLKFVRLHELPHPPGANLFFLSQKKES